VERGCRGWHELASDHNVGDYCKLTLFGSFLVVMPYFAAAASWAYRRQAENEEERRCFHGQTRLIMCKQTFSFSNAVRSPSGLSSNASVSSKEGVHRLELEQAFFSSTDFEYEQSRFSSRRQRRFHLQFALRPSVTRNHQYIDPTALSEPRTTGISRMIHLRQNSQTLNLYIRPQRQLLNRHARPRRLHVAPVRLVDFIHSREMLHVREEHVDFEDSVEA
jgi:hypothetical protein